MPDTPRAAFAPIDVDAVLFDLLTALLDSWSVWNRAAGNATDGRRWRQRYLEITYAAGAYRPYEALLRESAIAADLHEEVVQALLDAWDSMEPWPEVPQVLAALGSERRVGVVTNCSEALAHRAAKRLGYDGALVISAERAGAYKPDPRPYRAALDALGRPADRVLFVAGSPFDIPGAGGVGMPVVWHNRVGLARPAGVAAPLATLSTLDALAPRLAPVRR